MKIIIVGGVAGGASAAARLRRLDEKAEIVIYERSGYISYANCGLPYYIGGVISDESDLTLQTPESFSMRFGVCVNVSHEVTAINTKTKSVSVTDLKTGRSFNDNYDKLIISTGARPVVPDFDCRDKRIFTIRTVEDTLKLSSFINEKKPVSAVVIGGGFIGVETAENLAHIGVKVTLLQKGAHLLNTVDGDIASFIHSELRSHDISLILNAETAGIEAEKERLTVQLRDGAQLQTDMVILAVGVIPDNHLAASAGLSLGIKGAVKVNKHMQTSDRDIYAVGDVSETFNYVTDRDAVISLAGPANKQGRIAADNICGIESEYNGSQGSSIIKIFDMTVASTGINERQAKAENIDYEKIILSPASHAGYYPGAKVMTIKFLYEKNTMKILGAQIVGYEGVDKRIDVIATALRANMKADELKDLDLAYAPPYSSAKDPVNMIGFIADNIKNGLVRQFAYEDLPVLQKSKNAMLIDTRTTREYMRGHAEGFINIPLDELRNRLDEPDKKKKIYVMCQSGLRSYLATRILMQNGYDAYNFSGGYRFYASISKEEIAAKECYPCGKDKNS